MNALIVTSASAETHMTQASIVYLASLLKNEAYMDFEIEDLSGMIDYFDPPDEFFSNWVSKEWLNKNIFYEAWEMDGWFKEVDENVQIIYYSSLFSTDILVHTRHAVLAKRRNPNILIYIGGAAILSLNSKALNILKDIFNGVYTLDMCGVIHPDYSLIPIKPFVTIYSGRGCLYSKCNFCSNSGVSNTKYYLRKINDIVEEFCALEKYNIDDVMLSSDMFPRRYIMGLASELIKQKIKIPYNIMLRAEDWVDGLLPDLLGRSGCTDVFVGAEAFDNSILKFLNKGTNVDNNINAIKNLYAAGINVEIGLILFIPRITKSQMDKQLEVVEKVLPYVNRVDLEILTITNNSEFSLFPKKYGIELWPKNGKSIIPSWCYGFSPDIPWTFNNVNNIQLWIDHYKDLKTLLGDLVPTSYYKSIDYLRDEFLGV